MRIRRWGVVLMLIMALVSCGKKEKLEKYQQSREFMNRPATIDVCLDGRRTEAKAVRALQEVWSGFERRAAQGGQPDGAAIDDAVRIMKSHGFKHFLVDWAHMVYAKGNNCRGKSWRIAVRHPGDATKQIDAVELSDAAMVNPFTGTAKPGALGRVVIAPTVKEAQEISFKISALGDGLRTVDALGDRYAALLLIRDDTGRESLHRSRHYPKFQFKYDKR